jgi:hypothetical protein
MPPLILQRRIRSASRSRSVYLAALGQLVILVSLLLSTTLALVPKHTSPAILVVTDKVTLTALLGVRQLD